MGDSWQIMVNDVFEGLMMVIKNEELMAWSLSLVHGDLHHKSWVNDGGFDMVSRVHWLIKYGLL